MLIKKRTKNTANRAESIQGTSEKHDFVTKFAHFERKARTRDEVVSDEDTARSDERFVAEVCKLQ